MGWETRIRKKPIPDSGDIKGTGSRIRNTASFVSFSMP